MHDPLRARAMGGIVGALKPVRTSMSLVAKVAVAAAVAFGAFFAGVSSAPAATLKVTERKITEQRDKFEIEYAYPHTGVPAIDRTIEGWVKQEAKTFAGYQNEEPSPVGKYTGEISYEILRNDGKMFAVLFVNGTYTGGAHPNANFTAFNFMLPDGADVEIGEVFTNAGIEKISKLAIASLKRDIVEPHGGDADWIAKGAAANGANFRNFILKPDELEIHFDAYQVAAYAMGPQEVHIPLTQLKGMMRRDPRAPSPGFDCAKASSEVERAICSSRELARLDRHVADRYFDTLAWAVDAPARAKIRNEQRAWLKERDTHCRAAAQPLVACLTSSYQARLKALENRTE
jgi:uncharacterized protein YecT (DUF1311 family)